MANMTPSRNYHREIVEERDELRKTLATVKAILVGTDISSLPHDMTLDAIAQARMNEIAALRDTVETNNAEALNWKSRLLEKIQRLKASP
jgi:hypothetical protein